MGKILFSFGIIGPQRINRRELGDVHGRRGGICLCKGVLAAGADGQQGVGRDGRTALICWLIDFYRFIGGSVGSRVVRCVWGHGRLGQFFFGARSYFFFLCFTHTIRIIDPLARLAPFFLMFSVECKLDGWMEGMDIDLDDNSSPVLVSTT